MKNLWNTYGVIVLFYVVPAVVFLSILLGFGTFATVVGLSTYGGYFMYYVSRIILETLKGN